MGTVAPDRALTRSPGVPATGRLGRPPLTTHATLQRVGIELFTTRGFEATSVDEIAAAAGISRRTFFRYFTSKADVVWGEFDAEVAELRADLAATPEDVPTMDAVRAAVLRFNTVPPTHQVQHRRRLRLLLEVPELIAHSTLRYAQWRRAVDEFAAARLGQDPEDLLPRTIGHCALGAALASYEQWLRDDDADLSLLLDRAFRALSVGFEQAVATAP